MARNYMVGDRFCPKSFPSKSNPRKLSFVSIPMSPDQELVLVRYNASRTEWWMELEPDPRAGGPCWLAMTEDLDEVPTEHWSRLNGMNVVSGAPSPSPLTLSTAPKTTRCCCSARDLLTTGHTSSCWYSR